MPKTLSLSEVQLVLHFQVPLNITAFDAATWAETYQTDEPILQQQPAVARLELNQTPAPSGIVLQEIPDFPRLILRSTKRPIVLQLQQDRIVFSWIRADDLGKTVDYPGYLALKDEWLKYIDLFSAWYKKKHSSSFTIRLIEIQYFNTIPFVKDDGQQRRLSEVFSFIVPDKRPINSLQIAWTEMIEKTTSGPRVSVQAGVGLRPPTEQLAALPVFYFNFTGVGPLPDTQPRDALTSDVVDLLHQRIVDVYESAIKSGS